MILPQLAQRTTFHLPLRIISNCQVFCRKSIATNTDTDLKKTSPVGGYVTVYKFPLIRHIASFSRLKIYNIAATFIGIPISYVLALQGLIDSEVPMVITYLGFSIGTILFSSSIMTNRFIGFIYFNEVKDTIKVAYIDYWGNRKDVELPLGDIVPLSEVSISYTGHYIYKPVVRYSGGKILKMSSRYGIIVDEEKYNKIFLEIK